MVNNTFADFPEPDHHYQSEPSPNVTSLEFKQGYEDGANQERMHPVLCQNHDYDAGWKAGYKSRA